MDEDLFNNGFAGKEPMGIYNGDVTFLMASWIRTSKGRRKFWKSVWLIDWQSNHSRPKCATQHSFSGIDGDNNLLCAFFDR